MMRNGNNDSDDSDPVFLIVVNAAVHRLVTGG
jgi:hypothetical protein